MFSTPTTDITAPMTGKCVPLDLMYVSSSMIHSLGDGFVILPTEGTAIAPFSGVVTRVSQENHTVVLMDDASGCELILSADLSCGPDAFHLAVQSGDHVSKGDVLFTLDTDTILREYPSLAVPCIVSDYDRFRMHCGDVVRGETTVLSCAG
ncbi:MAG: PTS glucose transporter subunit IIA [Butyricicoccus sp.]